MLTYPLQHACDLPYIDSEPLWRCPTCWRLYAQRRTSRADTSGRWHPIGERDRDATEAVRTMAEWSALDCAMWHLHTPRLGERYDRLTVEAGEALVGRVRAALTAIPPHRDAHHGRFTIEGYCRVLDTHRPTGVESAWCARCCELQNLPPGQVFWPCSALLHIAALFDPADTDWWHYGPTATDSDPARMWHRDCGGEVWAFDGVHGCRVCGRQDQPDANPST